MTTMDAIIDELLQCDVHQPKPKPEEPHTENSH